MSNVSAVTLNNEVRLTLEPQSASAFPASDIYVINGHRSQAKITDLIDLMGTEGLHFYKSNLGGANQGPNGLIDDNDVVLIKINEEWPYRGGTNTDMLSELIQAITTHPDGFDGEIVVADNGQWQGSMDWHLSNAEDTQQSTQDVVDLFSPSYRISTHSWMATRGVEVEEYSEGDLRDGYILYDTPDPESGLFISYPKFETAYGTYVSFKNGIWNGATYNKQRLKIINMPVLKSHMSYGVTASVKHYMGVLSEISAGGLSNGHFTVLLGGMGSLFAEVGLPTLNIVDAIWVNANPPPSSYAGPSTPYAAATRVNVLLASTDPVALDYWAAKHVLVQTANLIGYNETNSIDPEESYFGSWLNLAKNEIVAAGHTASTDESYMNVYVNAYGLHDIALTNLSLSNTIVNPGSIIYTNVTIRNQGDFTESFDVTTYYNSTLIDFTAIASLPSDNDVELTLSWNTTGLSKGDYLISANITEVIGETDITDNTITSDSLVTILSLGHDIALNSVTLQQTAINQGHILSMNVTAKNYGNFSETFNITAYANTTLIGEAELTLTSGSSETIIFTWNTTDVSLGNYSISATALDVADDLDLEDNIFVDGIVKVTLVPWDVTGDGYIGIDDIVLVAEHFGEDPTHPAWDSLYDVTNDNYVGIDDVVAVAEHFGESI
ncbi:MAG: DUF362 domain-containing protein [Candidatus Bathyarchaeota archaeon]|nr:MAG: DUF362 domain-containing protein [Candidatus Bathyarchaeota archaeon]